MKLVTPYLCLTVVFAIAKSIPAQEVLPATKGDSNAAGMTSFDSTHSLQDSAATVLRGETEEERMFWLRRRAFVQSVFEQSAFALGDSSLFFHFNLQAGQLGLDRNELSKIPPQRDFIGERLRSQQGGASGLLDIGSLIGQSVKYLASKVGVTKNVVSPWTILPSETEVRVMKVLWQKGEVTSAGIYAALDSTMLNYKEVNTVLENMVVRGLVERQQVSPRNEFTILGAFTIEMSSLNAKNREYVYRPRTSRDLMLSYLDAAAFSHQTARTPAEAMLHEHLRKLLAILAKESSEL